MYLHPNSILSLRADLRPGSRPSWVYMGFRERFFPARSVQTSGLQARRHSIAMTPIIQGSVSRPVCICISNTVIAFPLDSSRQISKSPKLRRSGMPETVPSALYSITRTTSLWRNAPKVTPTIAVGIIANTIPNTSAAAGPERTIPTAWTLPASPYRSTITSWTRMEMLQLQASTETLQL